MYSKEDQAELAELVFDGLYDSHHKRLAETLHDPLFDRREGLDMVEAGRLAYERLRHVHQLFGSAEDVASDPRTLFAANEWSCLLDTTALPLTTVHYNLCVGTILQHGAGRPELRPYLDELDDMSSIGMFMVTEVGFGNNVSTLETEAVYDQATDTFVLNTPSARAQKFMPFTGITDIPKIAVVMARLKVSGKDCGVFPFLVRIADADGLCPGVLAHKCPDKPGLALDNGMTWFDHVRIPRAHLLSGTTSDLSADGVFTSSLSRRGRFLRSLDRVNTGRVCLSSALVTASRAAVYLAVRYSWRRETAAPGRGTVPIMFFRAHQLALLGALSKVYAMTFFLNEVKREFARSFPPADPELFRVAGIAKALSSWEMTDVITVCRERVGAQGMFSVNRIADYVAMAQGVVTAEGDNLPLFATVASELLAQRGTDVPVLEPGDLLDGEFVTNLFGFKAETLRHETRERMTAASASFSSAWNNNMNRACEMAKAHGTRLVLRSFWDAVDRAESDTLREPLRLLACLYGLLHLSEDSGWYLARGVVTAEQVTGLPELVDSVCEQLVDHSHLLVDGFNLSPGLLRAPIGQDDYLAATDAHIRSARG